MDTADVAGIKKTVRVYVTVFAALLALTIITVTISTFHLDPPAAIAVALLIASVKGSLVAAYFMHLISEKKLIYAALGLTAIFFLALMFLPVSHYADRGL
ncbi:MAG TPA: cytochrome C oxidase subunit IV family protein [Bacteroidota bacterium]|nr:cytochrome C oxidase subunit IV family protein [Bacteroidota bacterium]